MSIFSLWKLVFQTQNAVPEPELPCAGALWCPWSKQNGGLRSRTQSTGLKITIPTDTYSTPTLTRLLCRPAIPGQARTNSYLHVCWTVCQPPQICCWSWAYLSYRIPLPEDTFGLHRVTGSKWQEHKSCGEVLVSAKTAESSSPHWLAGARSRQGNIEIWGSTSPLLFTSTSQLCSRSLLLSITSGDGYVSIRTFN